MSDPPIDRAAQLAARRDRARARELARARARRRGVIFFSTLALVMVVALAWAISGSGDSISPSRPSADAGSRSPAAQVRPPTLSLAAPATSRVPGTIPPMPFPAAGEGAVALSGTGVIAASPNERSIPIASVTKIMTAYLVLRVHPLTGDEEGPHFHFTQADHDAWVRYSEDDLSNVELVNGEVLSERQLLEALLIPSADNVADDFARWVGGTEARFVSMMNSTAAAFGMTRTHYADASGVNPHSVSTAADQALLASIVMRNPVFRSIVAMNDVPFPVAGHIWNYNPALGTDGIIGVKSGFTQAADGCLVTAAWRTVGGRRVLVVSAVTGQPMGLGEAGTADEALLDAATARLQLISPWGPLVRVAHVRVPWSHSSLSASITSPVRLAGWGGLSLSSKLVCTRPTSQNLRHGWAAGSVIGRLEVRSQFGPVADFPVEVTRAIAPPPAGSVFVSSVVTLPTGQ